MQSRSLFIKSCPTSCVQPRRNGIRILTEYINLRDKSTARSGMHVSSPPPQTQSLILERSFHASIRIARKWIILTVLLWSNLFPYFCPTRCFLPTPTNFPAMLFHFFRTWAWSHSQTNACPSFRIIVLALPASKHGCFTEPNNYRLIFLHQVI